MIFSFFHRCVIPWLTKTTNAFSFPLSAKYCPNFFISSSMHDLLFLLLQDLKITQQILYSTWILTLYWYPFYLWNINIFQKFCVSRWSQWKVWWAYEARWGSQLKGSLQPSIFLSYILVSHTSFQPSSSSVPFSLSQLSFLIAKYEKLHGNLTRLDLWL